MKKIYALMALLLAVTGVRAQQSEEATQQQDSLQQVVNQLTAERDSYKQADLNRRIWKDRAKYFNIGYVKQTLTDKTFGGDITSDVGISLSSGKTYYLHKKPIAGMIKFGLDWTWMDVNYAKSTLWTLDEDSGSLSKSAMHQAEIGMQFGASVTVNPVHHLKVSGYFRVTPSYSGLYMNEAFHHHYVTMLNAGCAVAWKLISVGVEWRWGSANYNGLSFADVNEDDITVDESEDPSWDDVVDEVFGQLSTGTRDECEQEDGLQRCGPFFCGRDGIKADPGLHGENISLSLHLRYDDAANHTDTDVRTAGLDRCAGSNVPPRGDSERAAARCAALRVGPRRDPDGGCDPADRLDLCVASHAGVGAGGRRGR